MQFAKEMESSSSDVMGYGLASKPITGMSQDALWKAMLYAMRNPAECGLKVDGVSLRDMKVTCSAPCASWRSWAAPPWLTTSG